MSAKPKTKTEAVALAAEEKIRKNRVDAITDAELVGLEAIVSKTDCPTIPVVDDTIGGVPGPKWRRLEQDAKWLTPFIRAAGRLDCEELPFGYAGTAFLVGEGLAMTNRHVALQIARGVGTKGLKLGLRTELDHHRESKAPHERDLVKVKDVRLIHPYWDVAILGVDVDAKRPPAKLASNPVEGLYRDIAIIGYPAIVAETAYEEKVLQRNFGTDRGSWKRLQPGKTDEEVSYQPRDFPRVTTPTHNASTLGGNSGSIVVDLDAKLAIGIHFAGLKYTRNYFVPMWRLYADPRMRDLGLTFSKHAGGRIKADQEVEAAWKGLEEAPVRVKRTRARAKVSGTDAPEVVQRDWFERADGEAVTHVSEDRLRDVVGDEQAETLTTARPVPGIEESITDSRLPDIVLVHGFLGGHLDDVGLGSRRSWLSPWMFVRSSFARELTLAANGEDAADSGRHLQPSGMLQLAYRAAIHAWRAEGFVVHEFSFDWRKRIEQSADRLHYMIEAIALERRNKIALVTHSMGGLVACLYAQRHASWQERVQSAILIGPPLRGTYAPVQAAVGTHPLQRKLALISVSTIDELATMMRSFPGLAQLMPDPEVFPDAHDLYRASTWPSELRPPQSQLDEARNIKALVATSPLLRRASVIASIRRPTVDSIVAATHGSASTWRLNEEMGSGDGTVPTKSAAIEGVDLAIVDADHSLMLTSRDVHRAVSARLRGGAFPTDLQRDRGDLPLEERVPRPKPTPVPEGVDPFAPLAARLQNELDWESISWLLSSDMEPPR